ncbi:uncharacterized protein LOC109542247 isoform X1 [Dendroctonus ponderosae]|uniref:uncharacterized protein LOC109542247 isoform X1 n=1 Tax=Dendroctonus ponderosae TaxID=77166 RepID=UPI002035C0E1|nr:uncharacterized protein LOC109542247 isoform X1 [Dendroctonus ponderosae]
MADDVQRRMEQIAPSIRVMKESALFNQEEVNLIVSRLKSLECRMATGLKDVKHFQAAIGYEVGLVSELIKRRLAVQHSSKQMTNLEFVFLKRIRLHYRTGLDYFPTDYNFNMEYFSFLSNYKEHFKSFIVIHIRNLLARFSHVPLVYIRIANWYHENDLMQDAQKVLLRGQSRHPKFGALYIDFMKLELENTPVNEKKILLCLDMMVENKLPSMDFQVAYGWFKQKRASPGLQDYVIEQMKTHHKQDGAMWAFIALRSFIIYTKNEPRISMPKLQKVLADFKCNLAEVPSKKQPEFCRQFVDALLVDFSPDGKASMKRLGVKILEAAVAANIPLTEDHLEKWVFFCEEGDGDLLTMQLKSLVSDLEKQPSEKLWYLYVVHLIRQDAEWSEIESAFNTALLNRAPNYVKLFDIYLKAGDLYDKLTPAKRRQIFETSLKTSKLVALHMKPRYFLYILATEGIAGARNLYARISATDPPSEELHEEMLNAELQQPLEGLQVRAKPVLNTWMKQFGSTGCRVHLRKVEIARIISGPDVNEQIRAIFEHAMASLRTQELREEFKEKYQEIC